MKATFLNPVCKEVYESNKLKDFDVKKEKLGQTLCLIHSEISEALEAARTNSYTDANLNAVGGWVLDEDFILAYKVMIKGTFEEEIADAFIRLMDLVGALEMDIDKHIELKRRYNSLREYKHGKSF